MKLKKEITVLHATAGMHKLRISVLFVIQALDVLKRSTHANNHAREMDNENYLLPVDAQGP